MADNHRCQAEGNLCQTVRGRLSWLRIRKDWSSEETAEVPANLIFSKACSNDSSSFLWQYCTNGRCSANNQAKRRLKIADRTRRNVSPRVRWRREQRITFICRVDVHCVPHPFRGEKKTKELYHSISFSVFSLPIKSVIASVISARDLKFSSILTMHSFSWDKDKIANTP